MAKYTVKKGETLGGIGKQLGVDWRKITGFRSGDPNLIYPGEVLTIPGAGGTERVSFPGKESEKKYSTLADKPTTFVPPTTSEGIAAQDEATRAGFPETDFKLGEDVQTQISDTQSQVADLQVQQDALTQYGLTDTDQLTQDASGNYVPIDGDAFDTGNDTLNQMLQTFQDTLDTILDQGQIINPKIDITPDILQGFLDQAETELGPYYKSQFAAIKDDLSTDLTYLSEQYGQAMKSQESQFKQVEELFLAEEEEQEKKR